MPKEDSAGNQALLAYTPMFHSRLFREDPKYRRRMFEPTRGASTVNARSPDSHGASSDSQRSSVEALKSHLDGNKAYDRPLTVQFCSNNPDDFLGAARHVAPYCDAIDLNLGCPQGIARKGNYGAFLQEDRATIYNLISTLHRELDVPVTAKMRILETREKTLEYARMIIDAGASILTVHGRRREQKGHITGLADWTMLRYLRDHLPADTVLFANGNILQHDDIQQCIDATGFDAVMSAEGNLSDPSVLAPPPAVGEGSRDYWRGHDGKAGYRMDAVFRRYLDIIYRHVLEVEPPQRNPLFLPTDAGSPAAASVSTDSQFKKRKHVDDDPQLDTSQATKKQNTEKATKSQSTNQSPNLHAMRPHLFNMLKSLIAKHTHVRDALAKTRAGDMEGFEKVLHLTETVTAEALVEYEQGNEEVAKHAERKKKAKGPEEEVGSIETEPEETSAATLRSCWRPWWICQPYVRPLPAEALAKGSITLGKKVKQQLRKDDKLARDVGLSPQGSSTSVQPSKGSSEKVEVPKEGLACG